MSLLWIALLGIIALLVLVIVFRMQAFVALLLVSLGVGLAAGMPPNAVIQSMQNGMGSTLGFIAVVVGLGSMLGAMLEETGGAQQLARTLVRKLGQDRASWAMAITGFLVSIPVFFDVGFIILVPLVYSLARATKRSTLYYAIPLLAGLAVTHAFVPPTPGPVAVAEVLKADLGKVILYGLLAGIPTAIVAGPIFGRYIANRIHVPVPEWVEAGKDEVPDEKLPSFGLVVSLILLPIALIVAGSFANLAAKPFTAQNLPVPVFYQALGFLGHPFTALIIATLLAFYSLGRRQGLTLDAIQKIASKSLGPAGLIILVTGAGGVFKQVLVDSKIGEAMAQSLGNLGLSPVLLAFLIASVVRIAQGSATVAMMTAAGFMAPILEGFPNVDPAWVTIAIASGATICSHVNDSGFWLVKQYLGMDEKTTFKTWTVMETIIALVGVTCVLILSLFI
nr:MAG: gluconate transporter [Bacillota bacterium]